MKNMGRRCCIAWMLKERQARVHAFGDQLTWNSLALHKIHHLAKHNEHFSGSQLRQQRNWQLSCEIDTLHILNLLTGMPWAGPPRRQLLP